MSIVVRSCYKCHGFLSASHGLKILHFVDEELHVHECVRCTPCCFCAPWQGSTAKTDPPSVPVHVWLHTEVRYLANKVYSVLQGVKLSSGQGKEEEAGNAAGSGGRRFREVQLQEPIRYGMYE